MSLSGLLLPPPARAASTTAPPFRNRPVQRGLLDPSHIMCKMFPTPEHGGPMHTAFPNRLPPSFPPVTPMIPTAPGSLDARQHAFHASPTPPASRATGGTAATPADASRHSHSAAPHPGDNRQHSRTRRASTSEASRSAWSEGRGPEPAPQFLVCWHRGDGTSCHPAATSAEAVAFARDARDSTSMEAAIYRLWSILPD